MLNNTREFTPSQGDPGAVQIVMAHSLAGEQHRVLAGETLPLVEFMRSQRCHLSLRVSLDRRGTFGQTSWHEQRYGKAKRSLESSESSEPTHQETYHR